MIRKRFAEGTANVNTANVNTANVKQGSKNKQPKKGKKPKIAAVSPINQETDK